MALRTISLWCMGYPFVTSAKPNVVSLTLWTERPNLTLNFKNTANRRKCQYYFRKKNFSAFPDLVGCIVSMLLWIEKLYQCDCDASDIGLKILLQKEEEKQFEFCSQCRQWMSIHQCQYFSSRCNFQLPNLLHVFIETKAQRWFVDSWKIYLWWQHLRQ